MPTTPNDTTTTLNSGSGGDLMDESLVTQEDGTEAKRPRVVLGGDDGSLAAFATDAESRVGLVVVLDAGSRAVLDELLVAQRKTNDLLELLLEALS